MNPKILLIAAIIGVLHINQAFSSTATCLIPLLCNTGSLASCSAACAAMCPLATLLHPPSCVSHYDSQGRPISVDCVCPAACSTPLTTTPNPRDWLSVMAGLAVSCGVQYVNNASYNCPAHAYHVDFAYEEVTGCPSYDQIL